LRSQNSLLTFLPGVLQACINATTLALITAGISVTDYVSAVTCGVHTTSPLLDLTNTEENDMPHLTLAVMPRSGKVTLATMETRLHVDRFEEILALARDAGVVLGKEMRNQIRARTDGLVRKMRGHIGTNDPGDAEMDQDE
jgi:exosome complex component RRP41